MRELKETEENVVKNANVIEVAEENNEKVDVVLEQTLESAKTQELSETEAKVKVAWIAGILLIIGGFITLIGVIYTSNTTVDKVKVEQDTKDNSEAKKRKLQSFDQAISSIQQMRQSISDINDAQSITNSEATKILEKSSQNLVNSYGGNLETNVKALCMDVCKTCNSECSFHKAKDTGRQAFIFVKAQPVSEQRSVETKTTLMKYRDLLKTFEDDISSLKNKFEDGK